MVLPTFVASIAMLFLAIGQVLLKLIADEIGRLGLSASTFISITFLKYVILLFLTYAIVLCLWIFVLQKMELSRAFPFAALTFVFVPLLSHFYLHEGIGLPTVVGGFFIFGGIVISTIF